MNKLLDKFEEKIEYKSTDRLSVEVFKAVLRFLETPLLMIRVFVFDPVCHH